MRGMACLVAAVCVWIPASLAGEPAEVPPDALAFTDAEAAFAWVREGEGTVPGPTLESARSRLSEAARDEPGDARWAFALGLVEVRDNDWEGSKPHFARAVELDGGNAEHHYWRGNAIFSTIDAVGLFDKAGVAKQGRAAYLRAIEQDPSYGQARIAICEYYLNAPGIAGGSRTKAREQADALLRMEGWAHHGHGIHATADAKGGDWRDAEAHIEDALDAAPEGETRDVYMRWIRLLAAEKRRDDAARFARRLYESDPDDPRGAYTLGACLQEAGEHEDSLAPLLEARDAFPDQASTVWRVAVAYDELDRYRDAFDAYAAFVDAFPDDERVKDGTKRIKKLKRKID